jgi:type IV pilus assembly protein PilC
VDYRYVAYTEDRRVVKGKLSATSEETATNMLSFSGYHVVSLKPAAPAFRLSTEKLLAGFPFLR